jgi:hypothetical protein
LMDHGFNSQFEARSPQIALESRGSRVKVIYLALTQ